MKILADEGVDRQIVARLREEKHGVMYVAELSPGIDDDVVLAEANEAGALLLTADKDFGELVYRQRKVRGGVILLRLAGLSPDTKARIVAAALEKHGKQMLLAFSVISPGSLRIRHENGP